MRLPRPRLTLRLLLLLVAAVAVVIGWHARGLHLRRQAIAHIEAKGGTVYYRHQEENREPPGPQWLRSIIGDDAFADVVTVRLNDYRFTDDDLQIVKRLTAVETICIRGSFITDEGLKVFASFPELKTASVGMSNVSGDGLINLSECKRLESILTSDSVSEVNRAELKEALPNVRVAGGKIMWRD